MLSPLHSGQKLVLGEANRYNWLASGRRWRKTTLAALIATNQALKGEWILAGAPTYDQVRILFDMVIRFGVMDTKLSRGEALAPGGGKIIFRSLDDPDNARGHTAHGVVFDECGYIKERAFYEIVNPMLADTGGWFWGIGTPNGRNWYWREHLASLSQDDAMAWEIPTLGCEIKNEKLIRVPHAHENPEFAWEELVRQYERLPIDVFRQEYLARFIDRTSAVFGNIDACLNAPEHPRPSDHSGHRKIAGLDWAQANDYTACSIGCADCKQELALYRVNKQDWTYMRGRVASLWDRWKVETIWAEENSIGSPNIEELQRDGYNVRGFKTTSTSKKPLIESMVLAFEKTEWQFLSNRVGRAELEAYERKVNSTTNRSYYEAPEGLHDDTVIARALMLYGSDKGRVSIGFA